jgi:hypothetical protein
MAHDGLIFVKKPTATAAGIRSHDRMRLAKLCRYARRPPVAAERLSVLADGRLLYRLKKRWRDGTTHVIFERNFSLHRAPTQKLQRPSVYQKN